MNDLAFLQDGQAMTDSLIVAGYFQREHRNVLQTIRGIEADLPEISNGLTFQRVEYLDAKGEARPKVIMNRDGALLLLNRFKGRKARLKQWRVIQAFNALEHRVRELEADRFAEVEVLLAESKPGAFIEIQPAAVPLSIPLHGPAPYMTVAHWLRHNRKIMPPWLAFGRWPVRQAGAARR